MVRLDKEIAEVAAKFVRVRLVRISSVDLRLFEFDRDLTWFAFLLNADETIYGRYGGRDAKGPDERISLKGLRYAMERALEAHANPPKPRIRLEKPFRASDFPAAKTFKGNCIHCHTIYEFERAEKKALGQWRRDDLWVYPLPENVGIKLEVDRGNRIAEVRPGSPASIAGLKPQDVVKSINEHSVASFADASYALHKAPARRTVTIAWLRSGQEHSAKLELAPGWRKTNLSWRPSLLDLLPSLPLSGKDLTADEKKKLGLSEKRFAFRQDKFVHSTLKAAGLQKDDVVVGIDGKETMGGIDDFMSQARGGDYLVGDQVDLNILRGDKRIDVTLTLK